MTRAGKLVTGLGGGEVSKQLRHLLEILALFDRCRSMLGAIQHLLLHNFVHEAVLLGRPLFSDSLALMELAAVDERTRGGRVLGWEMASLAGLEGVFRAVESHGEDMSRGFSYINERRAQVEEYARRHGFSTRQWKPDDHTKDLAKKHGRGEDYSGLLITHHFVHGTTIATSQRYSLVGEHTVEIGGPAVEFELWANDAGLFAVSSALQAARAVCRILSWDEPADLAALLAKCEALAEKLRSAESSPPSKGGTEGVASELPRPCWQT